MEALALSWSERFALINHYNPTDEQITEAFGVTQDDLDVARYMIGEKLYTPSTKLDVSKFADIFNGGLRVVVAPTITAAPSTSSSSGRKSQKSGRVANALLAIPTTATAVDDFIRDYPVSIHVLKQAPRFIKTLPEDQQRQVGRVFIRNDKATGRLMIWKEVK